MSLRLLYYTVEPRPTKKEHPHEQTMKDPIEEREKSSGLAEEERTLGLCPGLTLFSLRTLDGVQATSPCLYIKA